MALVIERGGYTYVASLLPVSCRRTTFPAVKPGNAIITAMHTDSAVILVLDWGGGLGCRGGRVGDGGVDLMADRLRAQEEGYGLEALGWKWHRIDVSNTTIPDEFRMLTKDLRNFFDQIRKCLLCIARASLQDSTLSESRFSKSSRGLILGDV
jgi:hypothetical protein